MPSSVAGVFTYLLAQTPAVITAVDSTGQVFDGYVDDPPVIPAPLLVIGADAPLTSFAEDGTRKYVELGPNGVDEDYNVPCYILTFRGDTNQAAARAQALSIFDGFVKMVAQDMTLGGNLLSGRWAEIVDIQIVQTDPDQANDGRCCVIAFKVHCVNHYDPTV